MSLLYLNGCLLIAVQAVVSWENVFGPPQKLWLWTEKNQKALALLYSGLGQLRNTANSSVVPTEFAARN